MDLLAAKFVAALLLPPLNVLLLLALAIGWRRRPTRGCIALCLGAMLLVVQSMPLVADQLCRWVEVYPPVSPDQVRSADADAILVLAGGWRRAQEYAGTRVNGLTLERLAYGVWLHRRTGLPLAVTGGKVFGTEEVAEGRLMERALVEQFGVMPRWVEAHSRNTAENAANSARMLAADGVSSIVLVTQAFHMSRAVAAFENQGLQVLPAPTGFCGGTGSDIGLSDLVPDAAALRRSYLAMHELLGAAWYRWRYQY